MKPTRLHLIVLALVGLFGGAFSFAQPAPAGPSGNIAMLDRRVPEPEKPWLHQLWQADIDLDPAQRYVLSFWVKSSAPTRLSVSTKHSVSPWDYFGVRENIAITPEWKWVELPFRATRAIPKHSRLSFAFGNGDAVKIMVANVVLHQEGSDKSKNLLYDARFETGLGEWKVSNRKPGVFDVVIVPWPWDLPTE